MLEAILSVPVIVKVFAALAVILVLNSCVKHLGVSVAAGTLVLALWSAHSAAGMAQIAWDRFSSAGNLLLMLVVLQVIWLSSQMSQTGVMNDLVAAIRARVSKRMAMAALPAVIGLLPMPGGALFSAPLVDSCDADQSIAPELKAQTNHWFRHVWEYWWPLYPGVLLAMELTRLEVWQFALLGVPLSLCSMGAGYVFLLRRIGRQEAGVPAAPRSEGRPQLLPLLLPIIVVIGCYGVVRIGDAAARLAWRSLPPMNKYIPMAVGLFCSMAVLQLKRPLGWRGWREILFSLRALNMALIVALVGVYGAFVEARLPGGEQLVARMHQELNDWGVPLTAIIMIVPLVSGLATGLSVGFVGASFPIVLSLLGLAPSANQVFVTTILAYSFGYVGMLLSPVHVCLVVTSEHFQTRVLRNAAGLLKPAAAVLAFALLFHLALRWLMA